VIGFSAGAIEQPAVATIVCGLVGDDRRRMQHTKMAHVFLHDANGVVLRSCFWLGAAIRPYAPEPLARLGERLLNRPSVRRRMVPRAVMPALARHCAEEYANLAALLPELHASFAAPA
jgi:phloretin hydrolase